MRRSQFIVCTLLVIAGVGFGAPVLAQPAPDTRMPGPSNSTELSLVVATGNAQANAFGVRNLYKYRWTRAELSWEGGWIQAASRDGDRIAVVSGPDAFEVVEPEVTLDSQRLFSKLRYQRQLSTRHDWWTNLDAARDEPSNINSQFVMAGGLGTTWHDTERLTFRTSYGFSYTDEHLDIEGERNFAGYRLFYGLKATAGPAALESELTTDGSFDQSDDIRLDSLNGVTIAIASKMALKPSLRMLFRNVPAFEEIDLVLPVLDTLVGTVEVPKAKLDTSFTMSLVIVF